jgi:hypothetical protein
MSGSIARSNIRIGPVLEVHSIYATVRQPKNGDTAQVTTGYYTLADGVLTMTDSKGEPVR